MKVDFQATNADGSPRVYVGMHRPPMIQPTGYVLCLCGSMLQTVQMLQSHWQMGHFDVPLYEVPEESPAVESEAWPEPAPLPADYWETAE